MKKLLRMVLDLLFPPKCPFCSALLEEEDRDGICALCRKILPRARENGRQSFDGVTECVSPLRYQDEVRDSVHRFKFSGRAGYAEAYAALMAEAMEEYLEGGFDVITFVPLSAGRRRERGYDQAELLARALAKKTGCPMRALLRKEIHTKPQSGTADRSARRANVRGVYGAVKEAVTEGERVLLVDDVVTTGATLSECAVTLLAAGVAEVRAVTLARGIHGEKRA